MTVTLPFPAITPTPKPLSRDLVRQGVQFEDKTFLPIPSSLDGRAGGKSDSVAPAEQRGGGGAGSGGGGGTEIEDEVRGDQIEARMRGLAVACVRDVKASAKEGESGESSETLDHGGWRWAHALRPKEGWM